ncbi:hypothetical protein BRADI_3g56080v3 [Brachypodium distachyon]|nr:hypothetical protein BRADI_3g56080v3 [Brachypodium distachyon]PNT69470.1 hypothetical protein BRADI_3g56080v3 [Brachypodium distachyon]
MEEEWEEEDDAIENAPASGASTAMAAITDTASPESNVEDENMYSKTNELVQTQEVLNPPETAPILAQGLEETDEGSYGDGVISLEEILQEPVSNVSVENIGEPEEKTAIDDHFSLADLSGYPSQDDGYVALNGPIICRDPSNGDHAYWPLRTYGHQNHANGTLNAEEFFDTGNDTNTYSVEQQICPSDGQNLYLQTNGLPAPQQVDDNMAFYDASSTHKWVDGKDDFANANELLYQPENEPLFDVDDLMAYFDATEDDFKFDMLGSVEGPNWPLPENMLDFAPKDENMDGFTFDGISKTSANVQYVASSSGSHENLYLDTAVADIPMDDSADKSFGKRFASVLGSIPAPPAMASEFPPATGKSVASLSAVNGPSSIHVTAGIVQLGGLTFSGSSEHWPLQKNGDFSLLLSFTVESDVSTKSVGFDEPATQLSTVPMVLRGGLYLFFVSAMILMFSYKVGSCIYSR